MAGDPDAAKADDLAKVSELAAKNSTLNEQAGTLARELGATTCAGK